ncbi:mitochondrial substrate carrier family protein [Musa troglodytarum]|uniref:Mitochondrial substrate carrier family protein n=1 Tax=Musa troglodytarum TaxID=320322 RepID=A0A9E7FZL1_9LILI|nr:mitochondrial substrate carrier family protein [Musa troglodytarum]
MLNSFMQAFPRPLKSFRKCFGDQCHDDDFVSEPWRGKPSKRAPFKIVFWDKSKKTSSADREMLPFEFILCIALESLAQNLQMLNLPCQGSSPEKCNQPVASKSAGAPQFEHLKMINGLINGKKADFDGFLSNLSFARVGGAPVNFVEDTPSAKAEDENHATGGDKEETASSSPQNIASGLLNIPLSNVERLKSTLSTVSLTELIEFIPQLGRSATDYPDKKKLFSVQDFFRYAEVEGRRFFEELDRDGDGQLNLEDLEIAMRKRNLPRRYAKDFLRRTRSTLFSKSIGWKQFLSLMEQKEPKILRAYTTLCLSKSGTLQKNQILTSLRSAGLPASEDNAIAMMRSLNVDSEGSISYSHFRNFMLLLPSERLEDDPRNIWFEAATVVAPTSGDIHWKCSKLSGLPRHYVESRSIHHHTRVQASTLSFPELVSKLPEIGLRGLYRGSIPAILGQFSSTILGTAVRIPCEVLKQRLQAGIFDNVGEAIVELAAAVVKITVAQNLLNRDLAPWETVTVGALSGGLAAVVTTPFDVMKTRMMTAPQGLPVSMQMVAFSILRKEGPLGLFKGAVPRFFWIAPLGAMNFAGYELAKKAMDKTEHVPE